MDFDDEITNFRDTFWNVVIIALLTNVVAGIVIESFPVIKSNAGISVLLFSSLVILILSLRFGLWRTTIVTSGDIPVCLIYDRKNNNYLLIKDYLPAEKVDFELQHMSKDHIKYNFNLMDKKNKFSNEIFQYVFLCLLNKMHTHWQKNKGTYKSRVLSNNEFLFNRVNPINISGFEANPLIISDNIWLQGTGVCFFKGTKFQVARNILSFEYGGIKLNMKFLPASCEGVPGEIERALPEMDRDLWACYWLINYELSHSPFAKMCLFFYRHKTAVFYEWCKEVLERANKELDWNVFIKKNPNPKVYNLHWQQSK